MMRPSFPVKTVLLLLTTAVCYTQAGTDCKPLIFNGVTSPHVTPSAPTHKLGETVRVTCPPGYAFNQQSHKDLAYVYLTCLSNGWNASQTPNCAKLFTGRNASAACDPLAATTIPSTAGNRTLVLGDGTSHGSIYRFYCIEGYRLDGTPIIHCQDGWQGLGANLTEPTCQRVTCRLPPESGLIRYNPSPGADLLIDAMTSVVVTCDVGYKIRGPPSVTCLNNGSLDATPGCEDVDECKEPTKPCDHTCHNIAGSFRCQCNEGYMVANDTTKCTDVNECETMPGLCRNGSCQNLDGEVGGYRCICDSSSGYVLYMANDTEGHYIPNEEHSLDTINNTLRINHTCVLRQCLFPNNSPTNGNVLGYQTAYHVHDMIGFVCNLGYILKGLRIITCGIDGNWTTAEPQCEAASCTLSQDHVDRATYQNISTNGTLSAGEKVPYGEPVMVSCVGQSNTSRRECIYDRDKDKYTLGMDAPFTCLNVSCIPASANVDVGNGTLRLISGTKDLFDSRYEITCHSGAEATGSTGLNPGNETKCGVDGQWQIGTAYCQSTPDCNYTKLENMRASGTSYQESNATQPDCEAECTSLTTCVGYEWQKNNDECWIYTLLNEANFSNVSTHDFYRKTCFFQTTTTTTAVAIATDECSSTPCLNGGKCMNSSAGYTCECLTGYTGTDCSNNTSCNSPANNDCPRCIPNHQEGGHLCTCSGTFKPDPSIVRNGSQWWEIYPDVSPSCVANDPCSDGPCLNGGTCSEHNNNLQMGTSVQSYSCTCISGYLGINCQIHSDECLTNRNSCQPGGTCIDMHNDYTCKCLNATDFYNAPQCSHGCDSDPCKPYGTESSGCISYLNDYHCICKAGYTGKNCQSKLDLCMNGLCGPGTLHCSSQLTTVDCSCKSGWQGALCDQVISKCSQSPCKNGATCYDLFNDYFCMCPAGTSDCDNRVNRCHVMGQCYGDSACVDNNENDGFTCKCTQGLGDLVCKTRGEEPKQLMITKTIRLKWNNESFITRECGVDCDMISETLRSVLGPIRYLGTVPSEDSKSLLVLDNFGFESQLPDIKSATVQLSIHVKAVDIGEMAFLDVRPLFGPQAGGTRITIGGYNFQDDSEVRLHQQNCPVQNRSSVLLICQTESADVSIIEQRISIFVTRGTQSSFTGKSFTYLQNPHITYVYPLTTIESGGTLLNVGGLNFKSVSRPQLLTTLKSKENGAVDKFVTDCTITSQTNMTCPTPDITGSSLLSSRKKRDVGTIKTRHRRDMAVSLNDHASISITIGFKLDGVPKYRNLSSNPDTKSFSMITAFRDPKIFTFEGEDGTLVFKSAWPFSHKTIEIKGKGLGGVEKMELDVRVGEAVCEVTEHSINLIVCNPPLSRPTVKLDERRSDNRIPVKVNIGNLKLKAGHLIYIQNIWEDPTARYGIIAAIVTLLIIIIMITVCSWYWKKKKLYQKDRKKKKKNRFNHYIPRATRQNLMRPGSFSNQFGYGGIYDSHEVLY